MPDTPVEIDWTGAADVAGLPANVVTVQRLDHTLILTLGLAMPSPVPTQPGEIVRLPVRQIHRFVLEPATARTLAVVLSGHLASDAIALPGPEKAPEKAP